MRNRIGILAIFGSGCALALLLAMLLNSLRKTQPSPPQQVPAETSHKGDSFRKASSSQSTPAVEQSGEIDAAVESERTETLEELFLSSETGNDDSINWAEVEQLLRDHVAANHPRLILSNADYTRLADALKRFREAKAKIGSLERTSANAGALRKALEESKSALETLTQVTGMSPGEFFVEKDAPVKFGNDTAGNKDNGIVTEYLSDHKP